MNWQKTNLRRHRAAIMQGVPWTGKPFLFEGRTVSEEDYFTAVCLKTHEVGVAGPAEPYVLSRAADEAGLIRLSVHMLDCKLRCAPRAGVRTTTP